MGGYLTVLGIIGIVVTFRISERLDMNYFTFLTGLAVVGFWLYVWL
jgi:hypothetical protein